MCLLSEISGQLYYSTHTHYMYITCICTGLALCIIENFRVPNQAFSKHSVLCISMCTCTVVHMVFTCIYVHHMYTCTCTCICIQSYNVIYSFYRLRSKELNQQLERARHQILELEARLTKKNSECDNLREHVHNKSESRLQAELSVAQLEKVRTASIQQLVYNRTSLVQTLLGLQLS